MRVLVEGKGYRWEQSVRTDGRGHVLQTADINALLSKPGRTMRFVEEAGDGFLAYEAARRLRAKFPAARPPRWRRLMSRLWPWRRR